MVCAPQEAPRKAQICSEQPRRLLVGITAAAMPCVHSYTHTQTQRQSHAQTQQLPRTAGLGGCFLIPVSCQALRTARRERGS